MKDEKLAVFVDALSNYFETTTDSAANVGTPFHGFNHRQRQQTDGFGGRGVQHHCWECTSRVW